MENCVVQERGLLTWCLQQPPVSYHKLVKGCPNFLIISPPKTGSTWLAENFRHHPGMFVSAIKEVKYFSSLYKWVGLDWYLDQFAPGGNKVKGEASPSYALLPVDRIRLVRQLMPEVKLVFLMRDPIDRAWSHAKHNYRYREANFASCTTEFEAIADSEWNKNFTDDWPLASGDYLGQLQRWLTVFPREQLYIGYYEDLIHRPEALLRELFTFLGVDAEIDLARLPVHDRILPGIEQPIPGHLESSLRELLHRRTVDLVSLLREIGVAEPPPQWQRSLVGGDTTDTEVALFRRAFDDNQIGEVLAQEETFASSWRILQDTHQGHSIHLDRDQLYAVEPELRSHRMEDMSRPDLESHLASGRLIQASSMVEVVQRVDGKLLSQIKQRLTILDPLQQQLAAAHEQISRLEAGLARTEQALQQTQVIVERLRNPWYRRAARRVVRLLRRIRDYARGVWKGEVAGPQPAGVTTSS